MKTFTVKEKTTLKNFTDITYPQGSFCLDVLLKNKDIKVNGVRVKEAETLLNVGDEVIYYTTQKQEQKRSHDKVYEDENIIVCDKYSGVSFEGLCNELSAIAVHRLDRNTQGLIVFAKNKEAEAELLNSFKSRQVEKVYLALCKNNFKEVEKTYTAYLKKNADDATVKIYDKEINGSEKIVTAFRVLEQRGDIALVRVTLFTGKTHQIRAHAAFLACPVLGDMKYGDKALNKKYGKTRQQLISKILSFNINGEKKQFTSKFEL